MHHSLASVLLPEYRRRVLGLLLLRPEEALHGREIARRTGLPAGTVTRELTKLAEVGLLQRERRGNQQVYRANTRSPVFSELAGILRKQRNLSDYSGDLVPISQAAECLLSAKDLLAHVRAWLKTQKPELI